MLEWVGWNTLWFQLNPKEWTALFAAHASWLDVDGRVFVSF